MNWQVKTLKEATVSNSNTGPKLVIPHFRANRGIHPNKSIEICNDLVKNMAKQIGQVHDFLFRCTDVCGNAKLCYYAGSCFYTVDYLALFPLLSSRFTLVTTDDRLLSHIPESDIPSKIYRHLLTSENIPILPDYANYLLVDPNVQDEPEPMWYEGSNPANSSLAKIFA